MQARVLLENDKGLESSPSIERSITVGEALKRLAELNTSALLVTCGTQIVGVFSERDYTRKVYLLGRRSESTCVGEIMSTDIICTPPHTHLEDCLELMSKNEIRHLALVEDGHCLGLVSVMDVIRHMLSGRDFMIDQLNKYISGSQFESPQSQITKISRAS